MLQTKAEAYMRMALYQTEPELGAKAVEILPEILMDERVRRDLGLPEFDRVVVKPRRHSSRDADVTLLRGDNVVGKFSVKFSPTGNVRYCIDSWRGERLDIDLLALVPLRGVRSGVESEDFKDVMKRGESIYYISITRIPAILKHYPTRRLLGLFERLLDLKKEAEGLRYVWRTNIVEVARALRDYNIIRKQDRIVEMMNKMLELQRETLCVLKNVRDLLEKFLNTVIRSMEGEKRKNIGGVET